MTIKLIEATDKTNSYYPVGWNWSTENFPAFRGNGWRHHGFLAVAKGYRPNIVGDNFDTTPSKVIKTTTKGTTMVVPCSVADDEKILLITLKSGFRGGFSHVEAVGAEILSSKSSGGHCVVTGHLVVRLTNPQGFVYSETGRRCSSGEVEIFSWDGYKSMPADNFQAWMESQAPDMNDSEKAKEVAAEQEQNRLDSIKLGKAIDAENRAEEIAKSLAEAESRKAKANGLGLRLEAASQQLVEINKSPIELGESYFKFGWSDSLYTEENVTNTEQQVQSMVQQHIEEQQKLAAQKAAYDKYQPLFAELTERAEKLDLEIIFGDESMSIVEDGFYQKFFGSYCAKTLDGAKLFIAEREEEFNAAELAKKVAEEKAIAEAEAAELGLPQNVQAWYRTGGATNCGNGWVIGANGMDRDEDRMHNDNPRRLQRYGEGYKIWDQILPEEVVIIWSKDSTAGEHCFEVVYCPENLTEAQKERICEIEDEIHEMWKDRRGLSSDIPSPSIGKGWNLTGREGYPETDFDDGEVVYATNPEEKEVDDTPAKPASLDSLQALANRFN